MEEGAEPGDVTLHPASLKDEVKVVAGDGVVISLSRSRPFLSCSCCPLCLESSAVGSEHEPSKKLTSSPALSRSCLFLFTAGASPAPSLSGDQSSAGKSSTRRGDTGSSASVLLLLLAPSLLCRRWASERDREREREGVSERLYERQSVLG